MKKGLINILIILVIVGVTFGATRQWFPRVEDNTVTDTTYVPRYYEVEKIVEKTKPVKVVEYKTKYDTVTQVRVERDTVFVSTDLSTFAYDARFLTNYATAPKFLGAQNKDGQFDLTYLKTNGTTRTKTWDVGGRGYRVGLNNGQPNIETFKEPKDRFSHYIEGGYIRNLSYSSPYFEYSAEYLILDVDVKATLNINQRPFIKLGVKHGF